MQSCAVPWLYGARFIVGSHRCVANRSAPRRAGSSRRRSSRGLSTRMSSRPGALATVVQAQRDQTIRAIEPTKEPSLRATDARETHPASNRASSPTALKPSERTKKQPGTNKQACRRAKTNKQNEPTNQQGSKQANSRVKRCAPATWQHNTASETTPTPRQAQRALFGRVQLRRSGLRCGAALRSWTGSRCTCTTSSTTSSRTTPAGCTSRYPSLEHTGGARRRTLACPVARSVAGAAA